MNSNQVIKHYPLSSPQREIWFDQMLHPKTPLYNIGGYTQINGAIDPTLFESAVKLLVQDHEALRTQFVCGPEDTPHQFFLDEVPVTVPFYDFSRKVDPHKSALIWIEEELVQPFQLNGKPLFRFALLKISSNCFSFLYAYHHLIIDSWGLSLTNKRLGKIYSELLQKQKNNIVTPSYLPFVENDQIYIKSSQHKTNQQYWIEKYQTLPDPLLTPQYLSKFVDQLPPSGSCVLTLERPFYNRLITLATSCDVSIFHIILGVVYAYFTRTSQTEELILGLPVLNRLGNTFKETVGLFTNIIAARFEFGTDLSFKTLIQEIGKELKQNYKNHRFPISELNRAIGLHQTGRKRLFDISVSYEKNDYGTSFDSYESKTKILSHGYEQTPLFISVREFHNDKDVDIDLVYNLAYFESFEIERFQARFVQIFEYVLTHVDKPICKIPLLTKTDQKQLHLWNQTEAVYPKEQTVVDLFQAQVQKTPNNIAINFEGHQLTYSQLNQKANQLAHYLLSHKNKTDTCSAITDNSIIAICVERSLDMLVGFLGILKAGCAYVPLDPEYPKKRLQFMLEDTSTPMLLTQSHLLEALPITETSTNESHNLKVICLDHWEYFVGYSDENPIRQSNPKDLAYVIYTSGSTGKPKGVMIAHSGLTNMVYWHNQQFSITQSDKATLLASIAFDACCWELWPYLTAGASLFPVKVETAISSIAAYKSWLNEKQITITFLPTPLVSEFLTDINQAKTLRIISTGGDTLHTYLPSKYNYKLYNNYGPTENTIVTTSGEVCQVTNPNNQKLPHIGRPMSNIQIFILDATHNPMPPGSQGELCIAGAGLAIGYLNLPKLTAKSFIEIEIFGKVQRIYKTGDLARWLPDGNLEYLGRIDHQVKLRGYRIELSEIEVTLKQNKNVKEAVVALYNKENNPNLAAYVTLSTPIEDVAEVLHNWLKTHLPEYMLPTSYTVLDKLPITQNGKINRKALPTPDLTIHAEQQAPNTETEHLLCNLWSQALGTDVTSILSHFFKSGGNSLLASKLVSRIRKSFEIEMPLRIIFTQPILKEQAEWLDKQQRGLELPSIHPLEEGEPLVLSFAQQRLWFLSQLEGQSTTYNIPIALHLKGDLYETALENSFSNLIKRQKSLRLCFPTVDGKATVKTNETYNPLSFTDISEKPKSEQGEQITEWMTNHTQTLFNLNTGPLLHLSLIKLNKQEHILLLNMHHIISDGWSVEVLIRELSQLYNGYTKNETLQLPKLSIQYTDYAAWQRDWMQGEVLEQQLTYWSKKLIGAPELLEFPTDSPRPAVMRYHGRQQQSTLNPRLTQSIKQLSQQHGVTQFMTLLAAFKVLLYRYSGQTDLVVGSPIANRTHYQTENLIGFFANTLPLRSQIKAEQTFTELLKQIKQTALEAYTHQDIPFEYLVEKINPSRNISFSPLFQVMFVLQNTHEKALKLNGLQASFTQPETTTAKFDLTLSVFEQENQFVCSWEYNTDLFHANTITRITEHFQILLEAFINNPEQLLTHLPLLTKNEEQQFITWNQTENNYPKEQTIVHLFEAQAEKIAKNIAIVFEDKQLSYKELNQKANQLSHYLLSLKNATDNSPLLTDNCIVGICVERSLDMVIGLLAILKSGCAYVPLDPYYPPTRLKFMLEDCAAPLLLSQNHLLEKLPTSTTRVICLDSEWEQINNHSIENPVKHSAPDNLAYVLFTSGSTGKPKGVMIEHKSAATLIHWTKDVFCQEHLAGVLASTSINFDLSVFELFTPLCRGGKIFLVENALTIPTLAQNKEITLINTVPSAIEALERVQGIPDSVKVINLAGEPLKNKLVQKLYQIETVESVYNLYGPSEDTTYSTFSLIPKASNKEANIGRPISNTQVHILDANHNLTPLGIPGELCIAGFGLARGYLNRPKLTKEKFIEVELFGKTNRLYKTGDLARWLPDGNIEYLGRLDQQVKIRGFRIELPEIEVTLSQHDTVKEAVVVVNNQDDNPLINAYITQTKPTNNVSEVLLTWLKNRLPEYMLPSSFTLLEKLPLTPNGKIDRKALPIPKFKLIQNENNFIKPHSNVEQQIAQIWQELLKLEKVGIHDNFFQIGGHSLLLLQVQNRLQSLQKEPLPVVKLFQYPTIKSLAAYLTHNEQKENATPTTPKRNDSSEIAIIGMAGRFPGADDVKTFWNNLRKGLETIQFFSDEEVLKNGVDPILLNNPDYIKAAGILENVELFDTAFFDYTPKEAEMLDPQQRLFLEIAWTSLEHAGYDVARINFPVGVFAGVAVNTYLINNLLPNQTKQGTPGDYELELSSDKDFIATRTAYKLNLKGPALSIGTACSTSLVAVHVACQSLLNGECDMALAGGASVLFPQAQGYIYHEGMITSPDGHCRVFDKDAKGSVSSSGVGAVVLKRLNQALEDGDTIHAVIKGSAINNDGMDKVGFTAPSVDGQAAVITSAMQGVDYESISYVETHGTGTILGDPIEISALTQAYQKHTQKKGYCAIGSVKANIGHLNTAAGVTGLIKTALALKHREIPASLNFNEPNPKIDFDNSPFFVNTELKKWQSPTPLRAAVSSFGIGGTNAHAVMEEAPAQTSSQSNEWQIFCISAKSKNALKQISYNLAEHLTTQPELSLADTAYTLNQGRKTFNHRSFLIGNKLSHITEILNNQHPEEWHHGQTDDKEPQIVFMFPGQGAQYANMATGLYKNNPVFRDTVDECAKLLKPFLGDDIRKHLFPTKEITSNLETTKLAQPALFVIEYALAKLCLDYGLEPTAMIGHSIGEYVAACLSGVFSLSDALHLTALRGRLMQSLPQGEMLTILLSKIEIEALLTADLSIAAHNAPNNCVVSGSVIAINSLIKKLDSKQIEHRRLQTSHAFHSPMMEPIIPAFREELHKVSLNTPQLPYISNLTGTWITAAQATSADYWCEHLLKTVQFSEGIKTLQEQNNYILLELGPGRALSSLAKQHQSQQPVKALNLLRPATSTQEDSVFLLKTIGQLWLNNVQFDWNAFYANEKRLRIPLPTYPFEGERHWVDPIPLSNTKPTQPVKRTLDEWFYLPDWKRTPPLALQRKTRPLHLSNWLIFEDKGGFGNKLTEVLETEGAQIIKVLTGKIFEKLENSCYTINPNHQDDYQSLFGALMESGHMPEAVLHLWSLDTSNEYKESQTNGFYSLLFLAQTWPKTEHERYLFVISNQIQSVTGKEKVSAMDATLLGPVQTIGTEYPDIHCRNIDIIQPGTESDIDQTMTQLLNEFKSTSTDTQIAYRNGLRWIRSFEPICLPSPITKPTTLKQQGVYLITGGLGGLGLSFASYLAKTTQARLVLIGRTPFPENQFWDDWLNSHAKDDSTTIKIQRLRELQLSGAEVLVLNADVCNREEMFVAIEQAKTKFGTINGVIHAAGVPAGGVIQLKTEAEATKTLSPKVEGSIVLNELLDLQQLDFVVLCSSLNAFLGSAGQVDYCGANAFLDAYAHLLQNQNVNAISINWDSWQEVGMAANIMLPELLKADYMEDLQTNGITLNEGIEAFARLLSIPLPQVLITTTNWQHRLETEKNKWDKIENIVTNTNNTSKNNRPTLTIEYVASSNSTEQKVVDILQFLLGIQPVGIYDDFFELGGHSLLMAQLISKIHETFLVKLPMQTLFELTTAARLAEHINNIQTMRQQLQTSTVQLSNDVEEIEL